MLLVLRKKKKLTQIEMANKLGVSQSAYCKYEKNLVPLSFTVIKNLRAVFNLNINRMIDRNEL